MLPYLFTYKPSLAISRDPKLNRHNNGLKLLKKYGKLSAISRDPSFSKQFTFASIQIKRSSEGNMLKVIVLNELTCKVSKITPFRNTKKSVLFIFRKSVRT